MIIFILATLLNFLIICSSFPVDSFQFFTILSYANREFYFFYSNTYSSRCFPLSSYTAPKTMLNRGRGSICFVSFLDFAEAQTDALQDPWSLSGEKQCKDLMERCTHLPIMGMELLNFFFFFLVRKSWRVPQELPDSGGQGARHTCGNICAFFFSLSTEALWKYARAAWREARRCLSCAWTAGLCVCAEPPRRSSSVFAWSSLSLCVCGCVLASFYKDTCHIGLGLTLMTHLILIKQVTLNRSF